MLRRLQAKLNLIGTYAGHVGLTINRLRGMLSTLQYILIQISSYGYLSVKPRRYSPV